jgi:hypothetical protein
LWLFGGQAFTPNIRAPFELRSRRQGTTKTRRDAHFDVQFIQILVNKREPDWPNRMTKAPPAAFHSHVRIESEFPRYRSAATEIASFNSIVPLHSPTNRSS